MKGRFIRWIKSFFMHWHHWKPVPRRYEWGVSCRCGITAMAYLDKAGAKYVSWRCNVTAGNARKKYIQMGILEPSRQGNG
jgi:hypothetical protein